MPTLLALGPLAVEIRSRSTPYANAMVYVERAFVSRSEDLQFEFGAAVRVAGDESGQREYEYKAGCRVGSS